MGEAYVSCVFVYVAYNESWGNRGAKCVSNLVSILADTVASDPDGLECLVDALLSAMAAEWLAVLARRWPPSSSQC